MTRELQIRIADWHGEHAVASYARWLRSNEDDALRDYVRHAGIARRMWEAA